MIAKAHPLFIDSRCRTYLLFTTMGENTTIFHYIQAPLPENVTSVISVRI